MACHWLAYHQVDYLGLDGSYWTYISWVGCRLACYGAPTALWVGIEHCDGRVPDDLTWVNGACSLTP